MTNTNAEDDADSKEKHTGTEDLTGVTSSEHDDTPADSDGTDTKQAVEETTDDSRDEPSTTSTAQGDDDDETEYGTYEEIATIRAYS